MAPNGTNGTNGSGANGKHYNEGTFLFTVSPAAAVGMRDRPCSVLALTASC